MATPKSGGLTALIVIGLVSIVFIAQHLPEDSDKEVRKTAAQISQTSVRSGVTSMECISSPYAVIKGGHRKKVRHCIEVGLDGYGPEIRFGTGNEFSVFRPEPEQSTLQGHYTLQGSSDIVCTFGRGEDMRNRRIKEDVVSARFKAVELLEGRKTTTLFVNIQPHDSRNNTIKYLPLARCVEV